MGWKIIGVILLFALKTIGILIGIVLLLLLAVLFIPLRYRFLIYIKENKMVTVRISWFGFVVRIPVCWKEGVLTWKLRLFGIPILQSDGKPRKKKGKEKKKKRVEAEEADHSKENAQCTEELSEEPEESWHRQSIEERTEREREKDPVNQKEQRQQETEMSPTGAGKWISGIRRIISRIRGWVREICSFFSTAREMFRKIRGKIHSFEELKELFQMEHAQRFVCIGKKNMLHLWKQIRPRKLKGDILFGTGDPCSTGQCLGLLAVLYGWIGSGVAVTPDFEEKKLEGYLKGKGRLRLITSVLIVIRVLWNKDFKRLWKELKQWKEEI